MYKVGQAILGKIDFLDGQIPKYYRPYLIVKIFENEIGIINVSSIQGKEHKLLFSTNKELIKYNPPFDKPSFVKLDSQQVISITKAEEMLLLCGGECLDSIEMKEIIDMLGI